jgi:hypothetical protein
VPAGAGDLQCPFYTFLTLGCAQSNYRIDTPFPLW